MGREREDCDKHNQLLKQLVEAVSEYVSFHGNADGTDVQYTKLQNAIVNWNIHHDPPDYVTPNLLSFQ